MSSATLIKEIALGADPIRLVIQNQSPLAEFQGRYFHHIWLLIQNLPLLSELANVKAFAEISNFLWKGLQFQYIQDIASYQKFYLDRVELESRCTADLFPFRLTDYKIFDISVMHEPAVENGRLSYFVHQQETFLPYRVDCPFPYDSTSTIVHYQILPIKTEASNV